MDGGGEGGKAVLYFEEIDTWNYCWETLLEVIQNQEGVSEKIREITCVRKVTSQAAKIYYISIVIW